MAKVRARSIKRNPQDATLRNIRALKKRLDRLESKYYLQREINKALALNVPEIKALIKAF